MPVSTPNGYLDFTNATPRATKIIATSNVGIGFNNPIYALDVAGTANVADIIINNDLTLTGGLTTNTLTINSMSMSTTSNFQQVTNLGNATTNTVEFTNPTTGFAVSSNAEVGGELSVSGNTVVSQELSVIGNAEVGTANLFVDTTTGNVGIGMTDPGHNLDIVSEMNLRPVSNTASIKYNSNVVTEFVRSKKLIKYPRVALTADSSGGYVVSGSSVRNSSYPFYSAFDEINSVSVWQAQTSTFTNGVANTGTFEGITCQYISIDLGDAILLQYVVLYSRTSTTTYAPVKGKIYGSNDETNYTLVATYDNLSMGANENVRIFATTNQYFRYFTFTVEEALDSGADDTTVIRALEYCGVPEYDPEAHGTDVVVKSVPNVPNTDWLEVYYDGQDYTSMPTTVDNKTGVSTYDATPINGVGFDATQKAFTFDANSSQYLSSSTPISGNYVHTISMWFKGTNLTPTDGDTLMWVGDNSDNKRIEIYIENDQISYSFRNNNCVADTTLQNNRWYHLTCTYNGQQGSAGREIYVDGQRLSTSHSGNLADLNITNSTLNVGGFSGTSTTYMFSGSIANFRLFNRALTTDEVWQLYAYQKEYFEHGNLNMTLKAGRLGIGTSEPRAPLDIMGIPYGPGARPIFSAYEADGYNVTASGYITLGNTFVNGLNCYDTSTGEFTAPLGGIYCFIGNCTIRSSGGSGQSTWTFHINDTNWNPTSSTRPIVYQNIDSGTNHQQTSGSLIWYLNKSDTVRINAISVPSNTNQNWGQGYGRFLAFLLS